jgi:hypothetical protein
MIIKVELKLHRVLEILHRLKVKLINKKPVGLEDLNDIYSRLDIIYDTMRASSKINKGKKS